MIAAKLPAISAAPASFVNAPFRDAVGPEWRSALSGFIRRVAGEIFDPRGGLALALLVGRHRTIALRQVASDDIKMSIQTHSRYGSFRISRPGQNAGLI